MFRRLCVMLTVVGLMGCEARPDPRVGELERELAAVREELVGVRKELEEALRRMPVETRQFDTGTVMIFDPNVGTAHTKAIGAIGVDSSGNERWVLTNQATSPTKVMYTYAEQVSGNWKLKLMHDGPAVDSLHFTAYDHSNLKSASGESVGNLDDFCAAWKTTLSNAHGGAPKCFVVTSSDGT